MGLASLLMMTMLFHWAASEWQTEGCPEPCICHEVWVETLEAQLNAVDCAGRETTPSANLLNVYRAGSQPLKFHDIDTSSSCTSVVVQSFYQYLHASAARCADSNVFYHSLTFLERDLTTIGELPLGAQALILTGNRIRLDTIEGNLSDIQYLDLSSNELKLHKVDKLRQLFTRLTSLKALDLSDNYLESLMSSMFNDLELLESLSMNGNAVVYIERNTFQPLVGMRNLELADNHLTEINNNWFANGGDSLRTLDLRKNQISSVRKNDLMSLAHLEKLDLSWNQIVSIHVQAFEETRIEELLLGNNQLTSFPASQIRVLEKIVILNVDNNPIARLEAEEISGHTYLRQLSLSNMPLMSEIGPSTFVDLPNLKKVELYQNKELKYIDKNAFVNCPEVEFLYAHSNSLRGLDSSLLSAVMKLRVLSIYNNPLHCNCLVHWMLSSNLTLIDGDKVVCHTPHLHKNSLLSTLTAEQLMSDCLPLVVNDDLKATIEFGSDLQVECHTIGAHTISWTGPIHDAGAMKSPAMQHNGSSLTILGVKHADQGLYTCVATSEFGSDSQAMYVQVIHSEVDLQAVLVSQTFTTLSWTDTSDTVRSEERRVRKECRSRWSPYH